MTHDEDQLRRRLAEFDFPGEPVDAGRAEDDLVRARSAHRSRTAAWTTATAGIVALGAGIAFAVPNLSTDGGDDILAAGEANVVDETNCGDAARGDQLGFASTRQCLLEIAAKHFDPDGVHLPEKSENAGTGGGEHGWLVSSKLDWRVPGESGLGMVQVAVSTPGYADGESAEFDLAWRIGCEDIADCTYQTVPGTGEQVLVAEADPERNLLLGVMYERPDGSFTGVGVYDLFGNNSLEPVSNVDITLEQAIAFVTDPALQVLQPEVGSAEDVFAESLLEDVSIDEGDFTNTEVVPAPQARDLTTEEMRAELDVCVEGHDEWRDFEPILGVSAKPESADPMFMVIAERGDTKMLCFDGGTLLFGTPDVKSTPYLHGRVDGETRFFGRHTAEVDRITVHLSGEPQVEAIMKDGYWYLPYERAIWGTAKTALGPAVFRGYDAHGELVYDSTTVDSDACYTDPDGKEIVLYGTDQDPDVKDCIRMLEWGF